MSSTLETILSTLLKDSSTLRPALSRLAIIAVTSLVSLGIPALTMDKPVLRWAGESYVGPRLVDAATEVITDKLGPPAPGPIFEPEPGPAINIKIPDDTTTVEPPTTLPACVETTKKIAKVLLKAAVILLLG